MLYTKIALLALSALVLPVSPACLPQTQTDANLAAIQHLDLTLDHPIYLAVCRPFQLGATALPPVALLPGDTDNGMASLRVKTRASA